MSESPDPRPKHNPTLPISDTGVVNAAADAIANDTAARRAMPTDGAVVDRQLAGVVDTAAIGRIIRSPKGRVPGNGAVVNSEQPTVENAGPTLPI